MTRRSAAAPSFLPLAAAPLRPLVVWLTGVLVLVAVIGIVVAGMAEARLGARGAAERLLTVAVPPAGGGTALEAVVALLKEMPGVLSVGLVDDEERDAILAGWRPHAVDASTLPRLVEVAFAADAAPDTPHLAERLAAIVPGTALGDAGPATEQADASARLLRGAGLAAVALCLAGLAAIGGFVALTGIRRQRLAVDLVRQMGADEALIRGEFERDALRLGVQGSLLGVAAGIAAVLLFLLGRSFFGAGIGALPAMRSWLLLAALPIAATAVVTAAASGLARLGLARQR